MRTLLAATLMLHTAVQGTAPAGLAFSTPPSWTTRPPASTMRVAEFVIPKVEGDAEDAEAIVYFFGGSGGSVDANIDRWVRQMQQPDGSASAAKARRAARTINGLTVTTIDVEGTYVAEVRPGAAERHNKPGFRLRAAVIQSPRGPYYIKMTGPAKTMARAESAYEQLLASVRLAR